MIAFNAEKEGSVDWIIARMSEKHPESNPSKSCAVSNSGLRITVFAEIWSCRLRRTRTWFEGTIGPEAPDGNEKSWIEIQPGEGWFILLRIYAPLKPILGKTWRWNDIERVKWHNPFGWELVGPSPKYLHDWGRLQGTVGDSRGLDRR